MTDGYGCVSSLAVVAQETLRSGALGPLHRGQGRMTKQRACCDMRCGEVEAIPFGGRSCAYEANAGNGTGRVRKYVGGDAECFLMQTPCQAPLALGVKVPSLHAQQLR